MPNRNLLTFLGKQLILFIAILIITTGMPAIGFAQPTITEFTDSLGGAVPLFITFGPDNAYWFTEWNGGAVGRIDPQNPSTATGQTMLTDGTNASPGGIVVGPDQCLWFTEYGSNKIVRLKPSDGTYQAFSLPHANSGPYTMAVGSDGLLWFIEYNLNKIAAISTNATLANGSLVLVHESNVIENTNSSAVQLSGLRAGLDGNIWFTESGNGYAAIGRMKVNDASFTEFKLPNANCQPADIVAGPDGAMWFTEYMTNKIGCITLDGQKITEYTLPSSLPSTNNTFGMTVGRDGKLWFTLCAGSAIGCSTTNGVITCYNTPTQPSSPQYIATGSDADLWFPEDFSNGAPYAYDRIGRLQIKP